MTSFVVASFYKFVGLSDLDSLRTWIGVELDRHAVTGSILLASEGINGTLAASREGIDAFFGWLAMDERFQELVYTESISDENPFLRAKVKLKREIVTIGLDGVNPAEHVGTYVDPKEWNDLISDPDVILIDARNDYEVDIGTFEGAVNPNTRSFRELPEYLDDQLAGDVASRVAMFCTGGIRCEKSTSHLKQRGFENVYHLRGGILKYLEDVPEEESLWKGECFVFDERVTVNHSLKRGQYELCRACRMPVSPADREAPSYEPGVSCPHCIGLKTEEDKARFREREKQIRLAAERGERHIGAKTTLFRKRKQEQKQRERELQRQHNKRRGE